MEPKNKNHNKKNMTNSKTKTRTKSSTSTGVKVLAAVLILVGIGAITYFAAVALPSGCERLDNNTMKCEFDETFDDHKRTNKDNTDRQMVIEKDKLILKPGLQFQTRKDQDVAPENDDAVPKMLCATYCFENECYPGMNQTAFINLNNLRKNGEVVHTLDFDGWHLGKSKDLPYQMNDVEILDNNFDDVSPALAMFDSANPNIAIMYNQYLGSESTNILPISPGWTSFRASSCNGAGSIMNRTVLDEGFERFIVRGGQDLDTRFIQGLTVSKNVSEKLNEDFNITQADITPNISPSDEIVGAGSGELKGSIVLLASNDDGKTWQLPTKYLADNGEWKGFESERDYLLNGIIRKLKNNKLRYDFVNSTGHQLKWAAVMQVDEYQMALQQLGIPENDQDPNEEGNLIPAGGAGEGDPIEIGFVNSQDMPGGILSEKEETYKFYNKSELDPSFTTDNVEITSSNPDVLMIKDRRNESHLVDDQEINFVLADMVRMKPGYSKINVRYTGEGEGGLVAIHNESLGMLVLPKAYMNLDDLNISYTATSAKDIVTDEELQDLGEEYEIGDGIELVEDTEPLPDNDFSVTPSLIHRGHTRVILKFMPNNDATKAEFEAAMDKDNFKVNYGTGNDNLNKSAKVYFDSVDNRYYAVLKELEGGKKDDYNEEGFENGRMPYYFRLVANDINIYEDKDKTTTLAKFRTLNRKRTILYYYDWLFDKEFNLEDDYNWQDVQNGGLTFWDNTNLTLPGIRFVMLNDRRYEVFDKYLKNKKVDKNMVRWLYKKVLDRVYEEDLYRFGDQKGINFWLAQMKKIRKRDRISRQGVKFALSVSPEYRGYLAEVSGSDQAADAEFSYTVVLKRGADKSGLKYLVDSFQAPKRMREDLLNSEEYNKRLENIEKKHGKKAAIRELYETIYARPADESGVDYWDNTGKSIWEIKDEFLESDEFTNVLK